VRTIRLVHSSDLHLGIDWQSEADPLLALRQVLAAAQALKPDAILLAGDVFDHNRQSQAVIDEAADLLQRFGVPVVILPGNHDPLTDDSVYRRGRLADLDNVLVIGLLSDGWVRVPGLALSVWGRAHRDYNDMAPLRDPPARGAGIHVALAHGHYLPQRLPTSERFRPSWLIHDDEIAATAADYLALGHWNRPTRVGGPAVPAYYSGSPDLAESVNLVVLSPRRPADVQRVPLTPLPVSHARSHA
jgi:DNA repair exonuclease SbcCD nuclease subunit